MGLPKTPYKPTPPGEPCKSCGHPREHLKAGFSISWLEHLQANADNGCQLCSLIVLGIEQYLGRDSIPEDTTLKLEFNLYGTASLEVTVFHAPVSLSFVVSPNTYNHPSKPCVLQSCSPSIAVPSSTDSDESIAWVQERLRQCAASHELCKPMSSKPYHPARLLDIGIGPQDMIKLLVTDGSVQDPYICLSHRWGDVSARPAWQTVTANIQSHQVGIDWDILPATFQDAIHFTRRLGMRYLWIDSLCILQDDKDDWRREGSQMASIYSNSYLTLASVHNNGSESPMFVSLDPKFTLRRLHIPLSIASNEETTCDTKDELQVCIRHSLTHMARPSLLQIVGDQTFPLLRRGWVFQERFLSPRTVFFGPEELSWECVQQSACQCTESTTMDIPARPAEWAGDFAQKKSSPKLFHKPSTLRQVAQARGMQAVAGRWAALVEDYKRLDLTFDGDIFPALSGLAKAYSSVLGTRYYAGLWEEFLPEGLAWHSTGTTEQWMNPPESWRAPSWSWAAVNGSINFLVTTPFAEKCQILDVSCSLSGPDATGELEEGHVVLEGLQFTSKFEYVDDLGEAAPHKVFNLIAFESLGNRKAVNIYADNNYRLQRPQRLPEDTVLTCFLVGKKNSVENFGRESFYFLVLRRLGGCINGTQPVYKRVGIVQMFGQSSRTSSVEPSFFARWVREQCEVKAVLIA